MEREKIKLTDEELIRMLHAKIRREYRWSDLKIGSDTGTFASGKNILKVAQRVFDSIVEEAGREYQQEILLATRAVKNFNVAYVKNILASAHKAGLLEMEKLAENVLFEGIDRDVALGLTEGCKGKQGFKKLTKKLKDKGAKKPTALAAFIGRESYSKKGK